MPAVSNASYCCLPSSAFSTTMFLAILLGYEFNMHCVGNQCWKFANEKQHVENALITEASLNFLKLLKKMKELVKS